MQASNEWDIKYDSKYSFWVIVLHLSNLHLRNLSLLFRILSFSALTGTRIYYVEEIMLPLHLMYLFFFEKYSLRKKASVFFTPL
jgi:hypothetical protein